MQNSLPTTRECGFTLIELLIAIFIFGIVISSVYGAYRATFYTVHGSEYQLDIANKARVVVERLNEDLGSIVTGPDGAFRGERHKYADDVGDSLSFVSSAHLVLRKADAFSGHTLIQYETELDMKTGLLDLYRTETVLLPGVKLDVKAENKEGQKQLICQGLLEFRFTYHDRDGKESEEWLVDQVVPSGEGTAPEKIKGTAAPAGAKGTTPAGAKSSTTPEENQFPALVSIELKFAKSVESDTSTVFKTAIALLHPWGKRG